MDLDQLTTFDRVVREGSFSRAALALGVGQPAVSARIQALEEAVGGALLVRGRRLTLTALGDGFLPYARRAIEMLQAGVEGAHLTKAGSRGRLKLGALGSLAGGLVGPALEEFIRTRPDVECRLRAADHEVLIEMLLDGVVELALVTWPCSEALVAELTPLLVLHEPVLLVASPRHALAQRKRVTREELARNARPLLRLRWWQTHPPEITRLAQLSGTTFEVPMETARHLVVHGVGVGFFTRTYVAAELARKELVEIKVRGLPPFFRDCALVRHARNTPLSPASADFVEVLGAQVRRLHLSKGSKT
jgi:DNA-binding transcriptional LysR family regulator